MTKTTTSGLRGSHALAAAAITINLGACAYFPDDEEHVGIDHSAVEGVHAEIDGVHSWAHFTNPSGNEDLKIINHLIQLIKDTPPNETIQAAVHSLNIREVYEALEEAKQKGVNIQVVHNGADQFHKPGKPWETEDKFPDKLHLLLGERDGQDDETFHIFCGKDKQNRAANHGCITKAKSGMMHAKFFAFSKTIVEDGAGALDVRDNVVWFGSSNLTHHSAKTFNNAITIYGDADLYLGFVGYFDDLVDLNKSKHKHIEHPDYYNDEITPKKGFWKSGSGKVRVYASPERDGNLVLRQLKKIKAEPGCKVHVAQAMITDVDLVNRLIKLSQGKCVVKVATAKRTKFVKKLKRNNVSVKINKDIHDKNVLVYARVNSPEFRYFVFTGSHNWVPSADNKNDEILVRLESESLYYAYRDHFYRSYND
ncbi:phospholipase D-like domain-containing protein [Sorangium sp. So ce1078]|uniref:phospholipase D-like domain-containing protein n=1 Tax=Sorangium sp. So ce1078 TaxID=3133329 RepID=UPI003F6247D6